MDEIVNVEATTPTPVEPAAAPVEVKPELVPGEKSVDQTEATIKKLQESPELARKIMAGVFSANPDIDPTKEMQGEIETLKREGAINRAALRHKLPEDKLVFLAHTPINEIDSVAKSLADMLATNQPAATPAESATPVDGVPTAPANEAPAQAGTPLPVPESISGKQPLERKFKDIMSEINAQRAAGVDVDGACESAR